jgi:colanic acid/amylovoran biosynthesis glycosyltransferase
LHAKNSHTVCLIRPRARSISETFIELHADNLPCSVNTLSPWRVGSDFYFSYQLRRHRPSVVLAEYGPTAVRVMNVCRKLKIPLIAHFHGYDAFRESVLEKYGERYKTLFRIARCLVCVSLEMREQLILLGAPAEKVVTVPSGIDCDFFEGGQPHKAAPVFVTVSRFVEKKGNRYTLEAFARFLRNYPDARLHMIGDGPLLGACRRQAENLGISHAALFLGAQNSQFIREKLRKARGFIQHSVVAHDGDREGTPVAILEAGATGIPVISTLHGGIPDVIENGVTGLLGKERDIEELRRHLELLYKTPSLAENLGSALQKKVRDHYSMDRSIQGLWQVMEQHA